jgi:hypothetical protein
MYFNMKWNSLLRSIVTFDIIVMILYKLKGHKIGDCIYLCFWVFKDSTCKNVSQMQPKHLSVTSWKRSDSSLIWWDGDVIAADASGREVLGPTAKRRTAEKESSAFFTSSLYSYTYVLLPTRNNTHTSAHEPEKCILSLRIQWRQIPSFPRFSREFL